MQSSSLVKYHTPILVSVSQGKGGKKGATKKASIERETTQTEDILNSILPPREWTEDGQLWIQYVSSTPATRLDVINLQEQLDHQLQARQARETGICPVREELYSQCFGMQFLTPSCMHHYFLSINRRTDPSDHNQLCRERFVAASSS